MNMKLKLALTAHPWRQYEVAREIGVVDTTLSKFIAGNQKPTEEQKKKLAEILGKSVKELF
jgi:transcriptional regulator with XRE-family HTH domain